MQNKRMFIHDYTRVGFYMITIHGILYVKEKLFKPIGEALGQNQTAYVNIASAQMPKAHNIYFYLN